MSQLRSLRLAVSHIDRSVDFYVNTLGMTIVRSLFDKTNNVKKALLSYHNPVHPFFLCLEQHLNATPPPNFIPQKDDLYWKIGIALEDIELARDNIIAKGQHVSDPHQFLDIGYLCHLRDPDGYVIELLQHTFNRKIPPLVSNRKPLGQNAHIGQVSLRVKNIDENLRYYKDAFDLELIAKMNVKPANFDLYFFASKESPKRPSVALDDVKNREWLWSQPITTLELMHRPDMEKDKYFQYKLPQEHEMGCKGIGFSKQPPAIIAPDKVPIYQFTHDTF